MGDSTSPDAEVYAEVLAGVTEGYAFYTPYAEGVIGDCGIMLQDGQFVKASVSLLVIVNCSR